MIRPQQQQQQRQSLSIIVVVWFLRILFISSSDPLQHVDGYCILPSFLPQVQKHDPQSTCRYLFVHTTTTSSSSFFSKSTMLKGRLSDGGDDDDENEDYFPPSQSTIISSSSLWEKLITVNPSRAISFSFLMATCGAILGPFLDSYHSAFGVLQYDEPISMILWGNEAYPALTTAWWVPELFGLAGFIIGWLYIILDEVLETNDDMKTPTISKTLIGISIFTMQYWISGILFQNQIDRTTILNIMSVIASIGFFVFDRSMAGFITSSATALGGPLIEAGLIWWTVHGYFPGGYHYNDLGETRFFPLWIIPVYFLGGPANGNLARSFWNTLSSSSISSFSSLPSSDSTNGDNNNATKQDPCNVCNDTRRVPCPNCDGIGTYVAMGGRTVKCTSCNARGFVICRNCFDRYDEDPYNIDAIRGMMNRMPD